MKVYFSKIRYMKWMIANGQSEKLLLDELNNNEDWVDKLDGEDITNTKTLVDEETACRYGVETVFIVNRYNESNRWTGRIFIHPEWVEIKY